MDKCFLPIVNLVKAFNDLDRGISSEPRFTYEVYDYNMAVHGLGADLALLYALMWAHCLHFSVFFRMSPKGLCLEFIKLT